MNTHNPIMAALLAEENVDPKFRKALEAIQTSHIFPPIPDRRFDWCAYRDPEGPVGYGRTEAEAIADFIENVEDQP